MKITVEIDCTPEEARRAMGLPDAEGLRDLYFARLKDVSEGGFRPEAVEAFARSWAPMGEAGMALWRALTDAAGKSEGSAR